MFASPSRHGATVTHLLILVALVGAIVVGYAWYRGDTANGMREGLGARAMPGEQAIRAPQRDWSYGPVHHESGARP